MQAAMQNTRFLGTTRSLAARATAPKASGRALSVIQAGVKVGDKAPDFKLKNQSGKEVQLSKFFGLFGAKPVVLYFYPKDGTPGCTLQGKSFNDAYAEFKKLGAEVVGVSSDSVDSHASFCSELDLKFTLLADEDGKVRAEYGVPTDLFGLLPGRVSYVIGKDGIVKLVFNNQFKPEDHVKEALKVLAPANAKA